MSRRSSSDLSEGVACLICLLAGDYTHLVNIDINPEMRKDDIENIEIRLVPMKLGYDVGLLISLVSPAIRRPLEQGRPSVKDSVLA